jgi:hypothetical protein
MKVRAGQAVNRGAAQVLISPPGRRLLASNSLAALGVLSAGIQFITSFYRAFPPYPAITFSATAAACLAWGFAKAFPRSAYIHRMASADITLSVVVGDLFDQKTHIVVGFSDTFDTSVAGELVIDGSSVQGQLLRRRYGDDQHRLDRELSAALSAVMPVKRESRAEKPHGKLARYPMGTVAVLGTPQRRIFAIAYGRMGNDMVARSPVEDLWYCLNQLWGAIDRKGQRGPVSVPIMGSGLARVDSLGHENLLRLIVLSFVAYSRTKVACHELRIVIRPEDVARIDLIRVREFLRAI